MIGITERGDAAFDTQWVKWVREGKPAILISKSPHIVHAHLSGIKNPNVIVHATITGYGGTCLEPNVPDSSITLNGYYNLKKLLGNDRVILRIDPIIPTEKGIETAKDMLLVGDDTRVRISFFDNYEHVIQRFKDNDVPPLEWGFHAPLELRKKVYEDLYEDLKEWSKRDIEVCGEPGFECKGCISDVDCEILGVKPFELKTGQRKACACLSNKYELLSRKTRCPHECLYCYWKD